MEGERSFQGRVCLVAGGGSGLGRACAAALAASGATVFVHDADAGLAREVAERIGGYPLSGDISQRAAVESAIATVVAGAFRLDLLVHAEAAYDASPVDEVSPEDWDRVLAANLRSALLLGRAAIRTMSSRGTGTVVLLGQRSPLDGEAARGTAFAAARAALVPLGRALARIAAPQGVRVVAVDALFDAETTTVTWEVDGQAGARTRLGGVATPAEVARAILAAVAAAEAGGVQAG